MKIRMIRCHICDRMTAIDHYANSSWRVIWIERGYLNIRRGVSQGCLAFLESLYRVGIPLRFVCGDEHALQLTSRWLTTGSLEAPRGSIANPPERKFQDDATGVH